jgi:hypothetical protein
MQISPVVLAIVAILVGITGIASNAIGINDIEKHPNARNYLIFNLIVNIAFIVGAGGYLWMTSKSGGTTQLLNLF